MVVSDSTVDMGSVDPDTTITQPAAVSISVGGVGARTYTLSCSGEDFINLDPMSPTPTMPVGALGFVTHGYASVPSLPFSNSATSVFSSTGTSGVWLHTYVFDYWIDVPYDYDPGAYMADITYTVVSN